MVPSFRVPQRGKQPPAKQRCVPPQLFASVSRLHPATSVCVVASNVHVRSTQRGVMTGRVRVPLSEHCPAKAHEDQAPIFGSPHSASVRHSPQRSATSSHDVPSQGVSPIGMQLPPEHTSGPLHQVPSSQSRSAQSGSAQLTKPSQSLSSRLRQSSTGSQSASAVQRFVSGLQKSPGPQSVRLHPGTHIPASQTKSPSQSGSQLGASTGPPSLLGVTSRQPPLTQKRPILQSSLRAQGGAEPEAQAPKHTIAIMARSAAPMTPA